MQQVKLLLSVLISILLTGSLYAQKERHLSLEIAGSGGFGSINYEKAFFNNQQLNLHYRLGFSLIPIDKNNGIVMTFPLMVHGVLGKSPHKLDVGIGQAISVTTKGEAFILMPLSFGYRLQAQEKRYYLRIAYTPIISYLLDLQWQHWAGITFGFKLNNNKNEDS